MFKTKQLIIGLIVIVLLIGLFSLFKSIVDSTAYINTLDQVLSNILSEVWKFLSTPSIFFALLAAYFLLMFRDNIKSMFPAIKEIKAGPFSASLNYAEPALNENKINIKVGDTSQADKPLADIKEEEKIIDDVINNLSIKMCKLLLEVDKDIIAVEEWVHKIDELGIYGDQLNTDDKSLRRSFYFGAFRALEEFVLRKLLIAKFSEDTKKGYFEFRPYVREKVELRYNKLKDAVTEESEKKLD